MRDDTTFVGLDSHSRMIPMAVLSPASEKPEIREIPNDPKVIRRTLTRLRAEHPRLHCCYEAGPCGYTLYRQFQSMGIRCDVVAPALVPSKPGDRVKTDRRDAVKLARALRSGDLTPIRVPTPEEEAARDLIRSREDVRHDLTAARQRLSKFLLRHGRIYSTGKAWTQRYWDWVRKQVFEHPATRTTFAHYVNEVVHIQQRRTDLEKDISALAETEPYREIVRRLSCLHGIATLTAMGLVTEMYDFRRFENPRSLMKFVGLIPSEHSSGEKHRRGPITKCGNSHVRRLLVEAAWAYRHPPAINPRTRKQLEGQPPEVAELVHKARRRLHKRYARLVSRGKRSQIATVAVARELCGFLWALMARKTA